MERMKIKPFIFLLCCFALFSCNKDKCEKGVTEKVYVANEDGGSLSVFDGESCELLGTLEFNGKGMMGGMMMPHNVFAAPDRKSIWATTNDMNGMSADQIVRIYPHGEKIEDRMNCGMGQELAHVVLDDGMTYCYATANQKDQVIQLNVEGGTIKTRFDLRAGCMPHGMRFCNGKLWVATMAAPGLIRIDPANGDTLCIETHGIGVQAACRKSGDYVFVSLYDRCGIFRYNVLTGDTLFVPLPSSAQGPIQICLTPDDSLLLVCDQGMLNGKPAGNKLYLFNANTFMLADSVTVGSGPHGVCTNGSGSKAYVTNLNENTMCMVDIAARTVMKTVSTGSKPNGVAWLFCP